METPGRGSAGRVGAEPRDWDWDQGTTLARPGQPRILADPRGAHLLSGTPKAVCHLQPCALLSEVVLQEASGADMEDALP